MDAVGKSYPRAPSDVLMRADGRSASVEGMIKKGQSGDVLQHMDITCIMYPPEGMQVGNLITAAMVCALE